MCMPYYPDTILAILGEILISNYYNHITYSLYGAWNSKSRIIDNTIRFNILLGVTPYMPFNALNIQRKIGFGFRI